MIKVSHSDVYMYVIHAYTGFKSRSQIAYMHFPLYMAKLEFLGDAFAQHAMREFQDKVHTLRNYEDEDGYLTLIEARKWIEVYEATKIIDEPLFRAACECIFKDIGYGESDRLDDDELNACMIEKFKRINDRFCFLIAENPYT